MDCTNIVKANLRLHTWNAISLVVVTLLHVYSVLLPCLTHRWSAKIEPGTFEYPLSERKPPEFKGSDPLTQTMSLQVDDVFRMVEMSVLFGVLLPLSLRWLSTRRHIGIHVHRFVSIMYFVDTIRRHTHPHSMLLNTPVFVMWMLDKVWSTFWRRFKALDVHRVKLGTDYLVVFWTNDTATSHATPIGSDHFLRLNDSNMFESAHVFTAFANRCNLEIDGFPENWSAATVIRVFRKRRVPRLGVQDKWSHTKQIYDKPDEALHVTTWGPYLGEMSDRLRDSLAGSDGHNVTLVAAGSGINFIIDACQFLDSFQCDLTILFTTRDKALYEWTKLVLSNLIDADETCINKVVLAFTGEAPANEPGNDIMNVESQTVFTFVSSRINFDIQLPPSGVVFCQSSQGLKKVVQLACKRQKLKFYGGIGGKL